MKFVHRDLGETAEVNSGGGGRGLLREVLVLTVLTIGTVAGLYFFAGWLTDFAVRRISPEQEQAVFAGYGDGVFELSPPDHLAEKWERAQLVLTKLQKCRGVPGIEYRLRYDPSRELNAFAVPGGTIALTHGLLDELDEEIAMAFVIAHELGHFAGRDHLQSMGRQIGFGVAISLLMGGSPDGVTSTATQLAELGYSREQEREADAFAMACLDEVYGHRDGAERLFQSLEQTDKLPPWAYMFRTHPASAERIRTIRERKSLKGAR